MVTPEEIEALDNTVEACADALLTAAAARAKLVAGREPDILEVVEAATGAIAEIVDRTLREGPRPR